MTDGLVQPDCPVHLYRLGRWSVTSVGGISAGLRTCLLIGSNYYRCACWSVASVSNISDAGMQLLQTYLGL